MDNNYNAYRITKCLTVQIDWFGMPSSGYKLSSYS